MNRSGSVRWQYAGPAPHGRTLGLPNTRRPSSRGIGVTAWESRVVTPGRLPFSLRAGYGAATITQQMHTSMILSYATRAWPSLRS